MWARVSSRNESHESGHGSKAQSCNAGFLAFLKPHHSEPWPLQPNSDCKLVTGEYWCTKIMRGPETKRKARLPKFETAHEKKTSALFLWYLGVSLQEKTGGNRGSTGGPGIGVGVGRSGIRAELKGRRPSHFGKWRCLKNMEPRVDLGQAMFTEAGHEKPFVF